VYRILLITQSLPWPLRRNGGAQRTELLRRALSAWGRVDVVGVGGDEKLETPEQQAMAQQVGLLRHFDTTPTTGPRIRAPWPLRSLLFQREGWARRYRPHPPLVEWLTQHQRGPQRYDLIVGRYLKAAAKAGILDGSPGGAATILDFDDIDHELFRSHREADPWPGVGGRLATGMVRRQLERISLRAPTRVAATWVCSEGTRRVRRRLVIVTRLRGCTVLPNVPFCERRPQTSHAPCARASTSKTMLFVGDMTFATNRDGVDPLPRRRLAARARAVPGRARSSWSGKIDPADRVERLQRAAACSVLGYVDHLAARLRRCAFTVAPIWSAAARRSRSSSPSPYGRPCVTTAHCLRGYGPLVRATCSRDRMTRP
jgi:hypothetical protein